MNDQTRLDYWKIKSDNRCRRGYAIHCHSSLRVQESKRPIRKELAENGAPRWTEAKK
jgi:hypothetical protein